MALDQVDVDEIVEVKVEKEMSFFEHLEALRWHIIRALIAVASIATFVFFSERFCIQDYCIWTEKSGFLYLQVILLFW